jgi:KUP system potassium uptake protein
MMVVGALGVVYGDIGTSPLYALREAVKAGSGGVAAPGAVFGVLSLIVWSLLLIISLKYAILILRADNRGEGGILALIALAGARPHDPERGAQRRWCSDWWARRFFMATARSPPQSLC